MVFKVELIQTSVDVGLCIPVHGTNKGLLLPAQADALAFNSAWHRPALHLEKHFLIPGHALHEKGLQRQKSVGTLVSNQERRALAVPLINR